MDLGKRYALKDVAIIDGKGNKPQPNKTLVVDDGYIIDITDGNSEKISRETNIFDMSGYTVMPGLIDAHIHLFGAAENLDKELMTSDITMQALRAVGQARKVMQYGFTALRDLTYNGLYLKRIFSEGVIIGPRIICSGPGINHPACFATDANWETLEPVRFKNNWGMGCYNTEDIKRAIGILLSEGADQIKVFANGTACGMTDRIKDQHYTFEELKLIVAEAKKVKETKVIAHVFDNETAWDCLNAGVDTFEHLGFLDEALCEEMVKQNKYLVPTSTLLTLWSEEGMDFSFREGFFYRDIFKDEEEDKVFLKKCAEDFKLAHKKGVKIALGTDTVIDSMTPYGEFSVKELKTMVNLGMTPLEAIHSATQIGSEVLGLEEIIGTVEVGKVADLLILKENPAENIDRLLDQENIRYVLQNGKIVVEHGKVL